MWLGMTALFSQTGRLPDVEKINSEIWTGFKRIDSKHFGNGESLIEIDSFDPKYGYSRFDMVSKESNFRSDAV